jgi:plastocyanin
MKKLLTICFLLSINFTISHAQVIFDTIGAGSSLKFNGNPNNYVDLGVNYKTLDFPFTIEAWVNPVSIPVINGGIVSLDNAVYYYGPQLEQFTTGQLDIQFGNGQCFAPQCRRGFATDDQLPLNQWTHIAVVCNSVTSVAIYFNGVLQAIAPDDGSSTDTAYTHSSNGPAVIGDAWTSSTYAPFDGQIDEVRLWDIALTQSEIQHDMCKKINTDTTGLIGYWRADEASTNDTVYDYSSNHINGVIAGTVGREISDAPIGNSSTYLYSANYSGKSVRCGASNDDTLIADQITNSPAGVQVYAVNSPPYYTEGLGYVSKTYFGVFCANGTLPVSYQATYHYSLTDGLITAGNVDSSNLDVRTNATDTPWQKLSATLDTSAQTITTTTGQGSPQEYVITLHTDLPFAAFTPSQLTVCVGSSMQFVNNTSGTIVTTMWTFGGGSEPDTSYALSPTATFNKVGTYTILLTESNTYGYDTSQVIITVTPPPVITVTSNPAQVCPGQSSTLIASGAAQYQWSPFTGLNKITGDTVTATPGVTTTYTVVGSSYGCADTIQTVITVYPAPPLIILPPDPVLCSYSSDTLYVANKGSDFTWSPSLGLNTTSGSSVIASPDYTVTYMVTGIDSVGCSDTGIEVVNIIPIPNKPSFTQHNDTLVSSSKHDNQWYHNDTLLLNDTSQYLIITVLGDYYVEVLNEVNGCTTPSDTIKITSLTGINQLSNIGNQLSIYPNPFNSSIFINVNSSAENVQDWSLQITDVLGQTVYSKSSLNYSNDIDLSSLPGGVYFVTVINKNVKTVFPVMRAN